MGFVLHVCGIILLHTCTLYATVDIFRAVLVSCMDRGFDERHLTARPTLVQCQFRLVLYGELLSEPAPAVLGRWASVSLFSVFPCFPFDKPAFAPFVLLARFVCFSLFWQVL